MRNLYQINYAIKSLVLSILLKNDPHKKVEIHFFIKLDQKPHSKKLLAYTFFTSVLQIVLSKKLFVNNDLNIVLLFKQLIQTNICLILYLIRIAVRFQNNDYDGEKSTTVKIGIICISKSFLKQILCLQEQLYNRIILHLNS